ncbi:hypothetical protein LGH70_17605 [Hymenobacter sp. BT635]|uniref:DUF3592 domain-containing protein n=1 Tax=Hymenobacter nitidus TaxID=2880929 RepID=A0ABS8AKB1_9BACT|nr:hypothetical protein [Hymenobacter nitidus]MCB2379419.1 hypothetical protein [Hymenobacter nitidus]
MFVFIRENLGFSLLAFIALGFILKNAVRNQLLNSLGVETQAVIISQKNSLGNNNVARELTYSYSFSVAGKIYSGNSLSPEYRIGDSVKIKYVPAYPGFNEILASE